MGLDRLAFGINRKRGVWGEKSIISQHWHQGRPSGCSGAVKLALAVIGHGSEEGNNGDILISLGCSCQFLLAVS